MTNFQEKESLDTGVIFLSRYLYQSLIDNFLMDLYSRFGAQNIGVVTINLPAVMYVISNIINDIINEKLDSHKIEIPENIRKELTLNTNDIEVVKIKAIKALVSNFMPSYRHQLMFDSIKNNSTFLCVQDVNKNYIGFIKCIKKSPFFEISIPN